MDSALDKNAGDVWFTQPHAVTFADINQDGILDMVTGKRHHSHFQYTDPDNWGKPGRVRLQGRCGIRRRPAAPSSCRSS